MTPRKKVSIPRRNLRQVERGFALVLKGLGIGIDHHTEGTSLRAARAWMHELTAGLSTTEPKITTFPSASDQMVILRDIPIRSVCAHHLLPFVGKATVAYIPGKGRIVGLSKLSRLADYYARRPQVQEELTQQIADAVARHVCRFEGTTFNEFRGHKTPAVKLVGGVGVIMQANHACMALRGVKHDGNMITSALLGSFREPEVRDEFFRLSGF